MAEALVKIARRLNRLALWTGKAAAWLSLAMIAVILADVVLRRYFVIGSARLQELEWHLHGALFLLSLGSAYVAGAHVRIELVRERWSVRAKAWVELLGILFFLLPFTALAIWFGIDYAAMSYSTGEVSASLTGLGARWIIKGVLVAGLGLLLVSGLGQALTLILYLFGPKHVRIRLDLRAISDDTPKGA